MKILLIFLMLQQSFLLRQPIVSALKTGNMKRLGAISRSHLAVSFKPPFNINGFFRKERFLNEFGSVFRQYEIRDIEWPAKNIDIDGKYAVQSMNVVMRNRLTSRKVYYKFLFFMMRNSRKEWELYYLKGLSY